MNSIYVISPEQLQATLFENRMKKFTSQSTVQSILFNDFQPDLLCNPTHAFIFINAENKPYAIAEQIRAYYPHCFITFVLTLPDTETIRLFNEYSVSNISLPLTIETYTEIMTKSTNSDVTTINANGIDRVVQLKLKKHLRLV